LALANAAFDEGYKAVRGDAGVAISNLLSAVSGGLFVVFLNLKDYRAKRWERWVIPQQTKANQILETLREYQTVAFFKVLELQREGISVVEDQLSLFNEGDE
jgi:formiminotetrahydrofolate cyclodeaminase